LLIAVVCFIASVLVLNQPKEKIPFKKPASSGGAFYDKKTQINQSKKNTLLRRFIS
jgi:hypothetical protein